MNHLAFLKRFAMGVIAAYGVGAAAKGNRARMQPTSPPAPPCPRCAGGGVLYVDVDAYGRTISYSDDANTLSPVFSHMETRPCPRCRPTINDVYGIAVA